MSRAYRAGESIEDYCRACKTDRIHTVVAADNGRPIRGLCDYCRSEHNYRGGPRIDSAGAPASAPVRSAPAREQRETSSPRAAASAPRRDAMPMVSARERIAPPMSSDATVDL